MSLTAVPDDDEFCMDGIWMPGRQVRVQHSSARPPAAVAWITDGASSSAGSVWVSLGERAAATGLQPLLLSGLGGGTARPWDEGEFSEPEDPGGISGIDVARLLQERWDSQVPLADEYERDEELRTMFAPFGLRFPGLAPAVEEGPDPQLMRRALYQYTRSGRIGLVPASRPADILPCLGWEGACSHLTSLEVAAVLRSWEDRFGARVLQVGFADIRLLVSRPPQTLEAAQRIAAEHFAFCDEACMGLRDVSEIAPALVNNPFWDFWWD
jgi:hypothetical protein